MIRCTHCRHLCTLPPAQVTRRGRRAVFRHLDECYYCQEWMAAQTADVRTMVNEIIIRAANGGKK